MRGCIDGRSKEVEDYIDHGSKEMVDCTDVDL